MRILLLAILLLTLNVATAHAACTNPARNAGNIVFNADYHILQYCDGTDWIGIGGKSSQSGNLVLNGLAGHWKLDETAGATLADSSSSGNDGAWSDGNDGQVGNESVAAPVLRGLQFSAGSEAVIISNSVLTQAESANGFTATAWVKANAGMTGDNYILEREWDNLDIMYEGDFGQYHCTMRDSSGSFYFPYSSAAPTGVWTHIACVFDPVLNQMQIYRNGVLEDAVDATGFDTFQDDSVNVGIGRRPIGGTAFNGSIDDVRIYNRALSQAEIQGLYLSRTTSIVSNGLIGYWKLDETSGTIYDSSPLGNNGTNTGGGTMGAPGVLDKSYIADTNEYVSLTTPNGLDVTGDVTVSAWIKPSTTSNDGKIFSNYTQPSWLGYKLGIFSNNKIEFEIGDGSSATVNRSASGGQTLEPNKWYHVVGMYSDSGDFLRTYVNGVLDRSITTTKVMSANNGTAYIGKDAPTQTRYFQGNIDDVRVYNRILSDTEIMNLYQSRDGNIQFNLDKRVPQYFDGTTWQSMAPAGSNYTPQGIHFDGTSDYLVNNAASGISTKLYSGSLWFRRNSITGTNQRLFSSTNFRSSLYFISTDAFMITGNPAAGSALTVETPPITDFNWHHIMFSFDMTNVAKRHIFLDGIDITGSSTFNSYLNNAIQFNVAQHSVGAYVNGTDKFNGDIADLWLDWGTYIDLGDPANRLKFYNNGPVYLGSDGSLPTGSQPDIYLTGATSAWHTNLGTDGGFTKTGTLTDADYNPYTVEDALFRDTKMLLHFDNCNGCSTLVDDGAAPHNATAQNSVTNSTAQAKFGAGSGDFTGDGYWQITDKVSDFHFGSPFTIDFWAYRTGAGANQELFSAATDAAHSLEIGWSANAFYGDLGAPAGAFTFTTNTWHHIAIVYNGTTATWYANGVSLGSTTPTIDANSFDNIYVGTGLDGSAAADTANDFDGYIDDFRFTQGIRYTAAFTPPVKIAANPPKCTNPVRLMGTIIYNDDLNMLQYCDALRSDDGWVSISK